MSQAPCRDCGEMVPSSARGCPTCARNLEAERMLKRYFWIAALSVAIIFGAILLALVFVYGKR